MSMIPLLITVPNQEDKKEISEIRIEDKALFKQMQDKIITEISSMMDLMWFRQSPEPLHNKMEDHKTIKISIIHKTFQIKLTVNYSVDKTIQALQINN